jgi:hypothetical protein
MNVVAPNAGNNIGVPVSNASVPAVATESVAWTKQKSAFLREKSV